MISSELSTTFARLGSRHDLCVVYIGREVTELMTGVIVCRECGDHIHHSVRRSHSVIQPAIAARHPTEQKQSTIFMS